MSKLRLRLTILFISLSFACLATHRTPCQTAAQLRGRIDEALTDQAGVGLSVAVMRGNEWLIAGGFGTAELEHGVAADPETVFRIGSITKQFTAAAIMRLVEQGKVELDADFRSYLKDYPDPGAKVTVRHLLTHTSGIRSYTGLREWRTTITHELSHEQILALFKDRKLEFKPGSRFHYCNSGYYLLGILIERVTGQAYAEHLQKTMFGPLGLTRTRYGSNVDIIKNRAQGYRVVNGELANDVSIHMGQPGGAGAMLSTAKDLVTWCRALAGGKVVSAESYREMTTPYVTSEGKATGYGFGLGLRPLDGVPQISHGGGINGFRSSLRHLPAQNLTVACIANCIAFDPGAFSQSIAQDLLDASLDLLIKNATVIDGTGKPRIIADVGIRNGTITFVGSAGDAQAKSTIDGKGLVLAPGFIDVHNHSGIEIARQAHRLNEGFVRQGVTTVVDGADGRFDPTYLKVMLAAFEKNGIGTNAAFYIGHNGIRRKVMGRNQQRKPTRAELQRMQALVREGMALGALGLSTGLMYEPGVFSETEEVIALAAEVAPFGGIYDSHVRNPVHDLLGSDREVIRIGEAAGIPAKLGHLKAVGLQNAGKIRDVIEMVEAARSRGFRVVSDQYPYDGAQTARLRDILVMPRDLRGKDVDLLSALGETDTRERIRHTSENGIDGGFAWLKATGYSSMRIVKSADHPKLVGKYLSQLAEERNVEPFDLVCELLSSAKSTLLITLGAIRERDVQELLVQPWNMIASDGMYSDSDHPDPNGHPRSTGTFPRVLGHYVRELKLLTLEEAVRKMTSLPADTVGLSGRGRIAVGAAADLVLFDPNSIADRSTWTEPGLMATGVVHVLVAGVAVLKDGVLTGKAPGRFLPRNRSAGTR